MSVYKSQRGESRVEYVQKAMEFRENVIKLARKFPKTYRYLVTNGLLDAVKEVQHNTVKANAIFMHKAMSEKDFELRRRYLTLALGGIDTVIIDLTICDDLLQGDKDGNSFKTAAVQRDTFYKAEKSASELQKLVKGVYESDNKRWKQWQNAEAESGAESDFKNEG